MDIHLILLLIVHFVSYRAFGKVCETEVCTKLAEDIKNMMDKTVDPCDDFSSFVCGNMDKVYSIQSGTTYFSTDSQTEILIKQELKNLLETQPLSNTTKPETKASLFYKSCLNMKKRNKNTKGTILEFINKKLQNDNYEENLLNLLKSGMGSRMIAIDVLQDSFNPDYNILNIDKPSLILSEGTLRSDDTDVGKEQITSYIKYMNKVLDILGIWENRTIINEIVKLHISIAKGFPSIEDQSNPEKYSNKMKIKDIQAKCSEISWIKLINGVLKKSGKKLKENDEINVFSLHYIDVLCGILKEYKNNSTKKNILQMDLVWSFISDVAAMGSEALVAANEEFQSEILGITGKEEPWKTCVGITSTVLTEIISSMYVKAKFDPSQKRNIELMIENIKKALKSVIEQVTWMDSATKEAALIKLNVMTNKIGYPDKLLSDFYLSHKYQSVEMSENNFLRNYIGFQKFTLNEMMKTVGEKIIKDLWTMGSWEINAYYNPSSNEIVFPAAQLRFPMYDIDLPSFYNYGAIGSIIGHEILHGFDTDGSKFDSKGLLRQWWSTSSREEYLKKTQCIIDQYGQYQIYNVSLPSTQTVGEDIADNAGTRMSFIAANIHNNGKEQLTLPGLDFTYEQLFFIGQAKAWCTLFKKEALLEKMKGDVHTIWKYRIIGPQSNMPEFSKAFNCSSNKKMNRPNKCLVW